MRAFTKIAAISAALLPTVAAGQADFGTPTSGPLAGGDWVYAGKGVLPDGSNTNATLYLNKRSFLPVNADNLRYQLAGVGNLQGDTTIVKMDVDDDCATMRFRIVGSQQFDAHDKLIHSDRDVGEWAYWTNDKGRPMDLIADSMCKALRLVQARHKQAN